MPVCIFCGRKHPNDAPCSTQKNAGVFRASTEQIDYNAQFIVPVYLNNRCVSALRDSGNSAITLVDSRLVEPNQIVSGETIPLRGAFNNQFVEKPVAIVDLRSPHFACNQNIRVKVAVTALPDNLQCIIGNTLFTQYAQFQDIISVNTHETPAQPDLTDSNYTDYCAAGDDHGGAEPVGVSPKTVIENETCEHCDGGNDHDKTQISPKSGSCGTGGHEQLAAGLVKATPRLIDRETREQPSGDVDLNETDKSINITDRQRRRPAGEDTLGPDHTAVDTAERPVAAGSVIDTYGSHASDLEGDGQRRAASTAMTLIDGTGQEPSNGPNRLDLTQTPETNTDSGRRRPDEVTPPKSTTAMDGAEKSAADDGLIDTRGETVNIRQPAGGDGYRIDSNKQIINVQVTANNASHDFRDKGGPGGQRTDAYEEHRAQTSDIINAGVVQTRSMRGARNISPTLIGTETDSDNENWTDEEQTVDDTADTEFRRHSHIDISDTLTDEQRTAGAVDKQFVDAQRMDPTLQSLWTRAQSGRSVEFCVNNGLLYKCTPSQAETDRDLLLVVPKTYRSRVLYLSSGHLGGRKTYERIDAIFLVANEI